MENFKHIQKEREQYINFYIPTIQLQPLSTHNPPGLHLDTVPPSPAHTHIHALNYFEATIYHKISSISTSVCAAKRKELFKNIILLCLELTKMDKFLISSSIQISPNYLRNGFYSWLIQIGIQKRSTHFNI